MNDVSSAILHMNKVSTFTFLFDCFISSDSRIGHNFLFLVPTTDANIELSRYQLYVA